MLTLYYAPGACSMAAHIVLEESGEKYEPRKVDLAGGEQRTEAYLKINPLGRVPVLGLDDGTPLTENTAILPYLGKRFDLWPKDARAEAEGAVAHRLLRLERASGACPCRPARTLYRRHVGLSGHQGSRAEDLSHLSASRSTACWPDANGSPTNIPCSILMVSSSTPGACAAICRWRS